MTGQPAYTDADVQAARRVVLDNFHPPAQFKPSWHIRPDEMARAVLDAVAPAIAARALREAADEYTTLIPDILGHKVQAVFTEDLLEAAAEAERGFGK